MPQQPSVRVNRQDLARRGRGWVRGRRRRIRIVQKVWEQARIGTLDVGAALAGRGEADGFDGADEADGEAVVQAPVIDLRGAAD